MARLKQGINGPAEGMLGNHVHYIRKGEAVVRMRPHLSHKPRSEKQLARNKIFAVVMEFIKPLKYFINAGFKMAVVDSTKTAQNEAMSVNMKPAVTGQYPEFQMDYSKAIVTKGNLPSAVNPTVSYTLDRCFVELKFTWDPQAELDYPRTRDQVMMAAYLPENKTAFYSVSGNRRPVGEDVLIGTVELDDSGSRKKDRFIETYIAFVSDDREQISDSIYIGRIELPR